MPIPVELEPEGLREFPRERCHFCQRGTWHWHTATNTPVCETCAETHDAKEI